jgi:hypothetical protein
MFVSLLGNKNVIRILDFMICNAPGHYSKSEMIAAMHMGRPSFYKAWNMLETLHIVKAMDSTKNYRYYVINRDSDISKLILKLHTALSKGE